jgi:hypothetical protein
MARFILTDSHIRNGFTGNDFSSYAGIPVEGINILDLPHWDKLLVNAYLRKSEAVERTQALEGKLSDNIKRSSEFQIDYFSSCNQPASYLEHEEIEPVGSTYFNDMLEHGVDATVNAVPGRVFYPGVLSENIVIEKMYEPSAAFVLFYGPTIEAKDYWSLWSGIPKDRLIHFPDDGAHHVIDGLHEMRHLVQMAALPCTDIIQYYCELDSDLFGRSILRQARVGQETLTGYAHVRYLDLLDAEPSHFIAPALEALENGQHPPDFYNVQRAVIEIRLRLMMEVSNTSYATDSDHLKNAIVAFQENAEKTTLSVDRNIGKLSRGFMAWHNAHLYEAPDVVFSLLRRLVEKEVLSDKISKSIAAKMLEAVNYFNPDLASRDSPQKRMISIPGLIPTYGT